MTSQSDVSITALFQDAQDEGAIGTDSLNLLLPLDYNQQLQVAMGVNAADITASEVMLTTLLMDSSISMGGMAQDARDAHGLMVDTLRGSKQSDGILMATWSFDPQPIHGYVTLENVPQLDAGLYTPNLGHTPLYDSVITMLGGVVAKAQEFSANGVPVRSATTIISDGANNASKHTEDDVATLVRDLERSEMHIVLFIGIDDGYTDFRVVGRSMGIRDDRIMTPGNSPSELRRAVAVASQTSLQVSQTAGTVSQVGFAAV